MTQITPLLDIMARLRDPNGGCPWDLEQNFATIAPYTIEEAYEVAEAIARGDKTELRDELGDLLLQVVFHAQMAAEEKSFTFDDVVKSICEKMIRRHPHVFADAEIKSADAQVTNWENIKEQERLAKVAARPSPGIVKDDSDLSQGRGVPSLTARASQVPQRTSPLGEVEIPLEGFRVRASGEGQTRTLDNIPLALPALMRAQKLQARAARVGFDWPDTRGVIAKIKEELAEVEAAIASGDAAHTEEELGDLLFAVTNLARFVKADAETALRGTNAKFTRRFEYIEDALAAQGRHVKDATLDEMEALWNEAKDKE